MQQTLSEALDLQMPNGAFPSVVQYGGQLLSDQNGFMTALVLRELRRVAAGNVPSQVTRRALRFLESCESDERKGTFNFYPSHGGPDWIKALPEDADDTAIIALELLRHGRLDRVFLIKNVCVALDSFRLRHVEAPAPEWIRPGVFLTWLRREGGPNTVDCCVNANVAALFATLGLTHWRGYSEACQMIEAGILWAGHSVKHALALTPFYPHPIELFYAVGHAVSCGVYQLETSLQLLSQAPWVKEMHSNATERPVFSSAYGHVVWRCELLQHLRAATPLPPE